MIFLLVLLGALGVVCLALGIAIKAVFWLLIVGIVLLISTFIAAVTTLL